ncbi:MSCRAMM family protein [Nocardia macrotermitis]|uniref:MSCRAMM family protein n=1 Tax=Nocardia macrotermitis TaxID=2585198 RepID=UPI0029E822B6|nr:carboxypeptidase regulatory-like domain-containing protein [Nocardia macrotermitis]
MDEAAELAEATREGIIDVDATEQLPVVGVNDAATNGHTVTSTLTAPATFRTPSSEPLVADGRAISGRVVRSDGYIVPAVALTLIDQRGHQVSRATGNQHGEYVIEPPTAGSYVLIVSASGHQPAAVNVTVDGRPQRLDVPLQGSGEVSGTVRSTADLRPVAGATITLTDMRGEVVGAAVTGARGDYACQGVVSGVYTLVAVVEHMRPTAITLTVPDSGVLAQDVELGAMSVLNGSVWADGRAVPDAQVIVQDATGGILGSVHTDQDGNYSVTDLTEGQYTVVARGYPPVSSRVRVTGSQVNHDLQLGYDQPADTVNGHSNGRHAAGVTADTE